MPWSDRQSGSKDAQAHGSSAGRLKINSAKKMYPEGETLVHSNLTSFIQQMLIGRFLGGRQFVSPGVQPRIRQ